MIETAFLYFFRRSLSILERIYRDPKKLTVFLLLILVAAILSIRECRKDRDGERPIWDKAFANTRWRSLGRGLPLAWEICSLPLQVPSGGSAQCKIRLDGNPLDGSLWLLGVHARGAFGPFLLPVVDWHSLWHQAFEIGGSPVGAMPLPHLVRS